MAHDRGPGRRWEWVWAQPGICRGPGSGPRITSGRQRANLAAVSGGRWILVPPTHPPPKPHPPNFYPATFPSVCVCVCVMQEIKIIVMFIESTVEHI